MTHRVDDRKELLCEIAGVRIARANPGMEKEHNVEQWLDQVRAATRTAYLSARAGAMGEERQAWLEMAAVALGRAEHITALMREDEE